MTPSRRKGVRVEPGADEPTEIAVPRAPWDAAPDDDGSPTEDFQTPPAPPPVPDDAPLPAGTMLGDYRVEAQIGEGGMGVVYTAVHPLIGKRAAVKVLRAELCRSAFNVERFIDEARIVNQIGHPNIVDVFAFGQTQDGRSYFVMEWLKGESLRERIARARLDFSEICEIVRPLARALEAAHEQGVIHRDLKPDNIFLVDRRGEAPAVKLLDFGIAKLAKQEHRMERTATGAMVGTPQYIAPEQAKGYAIDARVDIYALGGILFELLTGRPPYIADNAMELVAKHLMEAVPHPATLADIPAELDDLVVRMLSKTPDGRPSLAEVAAVIDRTLALERTNVKARGATPLPLGPSLHIDVPTPTPVSSPTLLPIDLAETIRSPGRDARAGLGTKGIALLGLGFVIAAAIAYVVVSALEKPKPRPVAAEGSAPPDAAPDAAPPDAATPDAAPPDAAPPDAATPVAVPPDAVATSVNPPAAPISKPVRKKGRLELSIAGAKGARILVDGSPSGLVKDLAPGVHTVEVSAPGMQPQRIRVEIEDGKTAARRITLEPEKPAKDDLMVPGSLDPKR